MSVLVRGMEMPKDYLRSFSPVKKPNPRLQRRKTMNREILFRGKRVDNGEWVYGFYNRCEARLTYTEEHYKNNPRSWIQTLTEEGFAGQLVHVDSETVGQYTGLTDKNGKKIFEGDIVEHDFGSYHIGKRRATVEYNKEYCCFRFCPINNWAYCEMGDCVVVGNIYDKPDMATEQGEG